MWWREGFFSMSAVLPACCVLSRVISVRVVCVSVVAVAVASLCATRVSCGGEPGQHVVVADATQCERVNRGRACRVSGGRRGEDPCRLSESLSLFVGELSVGGFSVGGFSVGEPCRRALSVGLEQRGCASSCSFSASRASSLCDSACGFLAGEQPKRKEERKRKKRKGERERE